MMKTDLLNLLRRQPLTVNALCDSLGVTRNAVNVQLRQLEAEGLVRRARTPVRNGRGKPANLYEAAPGSEDVSSSAYQVVLAALLGELGSRLPAAKLSDILEQTGRRLARDAGLNPAAGFDEALRAALAAVERLGAFTEVVEQPGGVLVRNYRARSRALCEPSPVFVALLLPFSRRPPASLRSSSACAASASSANTWCSGRPKAHARRGQSPEHRIRFAALHECGY